MPWTDGLTKDFFEKDIHEVAEQRAGGLKSEEHYIREWFR
jgi:hypothetical protein